MDWPISKIAEAFPPLPPAEFERFVEDVRQRGQLETIKLYRGEVLDGRNRLLACRRLGVEPKAQEYTGDDPVGYAVSMNDKRRHLDESQRAMVAARLANLEEGRPSKTAQICAVSQEQAAELMGVSRRSVQSAKAVADESPELAQRVLWGELSVNAASKLLKHDAVVNGEQARSRDVCTVQHLQQLIDRGEVFSTIYADPPWQYGNQGTRASTGNHYSTMTVEQISALPVAQLADENAHLHLWTTNAFLFESKQIIEAWGFTYKSMLIWVKPQMGIGNYWRVSHEILLLGVRGNCPFLSKSQMSWVQAKRGRHSAKPQAVRQMVERVSPAPRLELFGRCEVEG